MKGNKKRVLFIFGGILSPFKQKDLELLGKHFGVKVIKYEVKKHNDYPGVLLKLLRGVFWADATFSWFAGEHAYWTVRFSKILRTKSIVVVGGGEVAKVPEIGYGSLLDPTGARIVKYVLDNADKVLTVDDGIERDAIRNVEVNGKNIQTVPTGYDYEKFKPKGEKGNLVITVSMGDSWRRVRLKGLDTFVKSAKFLPDVNFLVIGIQGDALNKLQDVAPSNVKLVTYLSQEELIPYYQKAKVYCQLSKREGLPNALCEAMLCGCAPVGTDVQGVRTAIGDAGFYVPYGDPEATAETIKKALASDKGKEARERIENMFSIERRERDLIRIIKEM